jgi:hypothetical protein
VIPKISLERQAIAGHESRAARRDSRWKKAPPILALSRVRGNKMLGYSICKKAAADRGHQSWHPGKLPTRSPTCCAARTSINVRSSQPADRCRGALCSG